MGTGATTHVHLSRQLGEHLKHGWTLSLRAENKSRLIVADVYHSTRLLPRGLGFSPRVKPKGKGNAGGGGGQVYGQLTHISVLNNTNVPRTELVCSRPIVLREIVPSVHATKIQKCFRQFQKLQR